MTKKFICSNNELDYRLNESGVHLGSNMMYLRRGFGMGLHKHISNEDEFLKHWTGGYRPHVKQQLYCGDGLYLLVTSRQRRFIVWLVGLDWAP